MAEGTRHVLVGILGRDEQGYFLQLSGGGSWRLSFDQPPIFVGARIAVEGVSTAGHRLLVSNYQLIDMGLDYTASPEIGSA
jgi:hypothetical protein